MQRDHTHAVYLALLALVYYDCVMRTSMHEKWRQTYGTFIVCVVVQTKVQWPSNPRRILPEVLDGKGICGGNAWVYNSFPCTFS